MDMIKVSANSRTSAVAGAIAGVIREHKRAEVQAIGAGAVNQAVKALVLATDYLKNDGIDVVGRFADAAEARKQCVTGGRAEQLRAGRLVEDGKRRVDPLHVLSQAGLTRGIGRRRVHVEHKLRVAFADAIKRKAGRGRHCRCVESLHGLVGSDGVRRGRCRFHVVIFPGADRWSRRDLPERP